MGPETEKTIPKVPNMSPNMFLKNRNQINLIIAHISEQEILDIITALPNKSTGPASNVEKRFLKLFCKLPGAIMGQSGRFGGNLSALESHDNFF